MMKQLDAIRSLVRSFMRQIGKFLYTISGGLITPNVVTTVSVGAYIPIAYLITQGDFTLAAILHLAFGSLDMVDGELARLTKKANPFGMVYDASTDRLKIGLLFAGVAQYLALNDQADWVWVPIMAFGVATTVAYVKAKGEIGVAMKHRKLTHHQINHYFVEGLIPYDLLNIYIAVGLLISRPLEMSMIVLVLSTITLMWLIHKVSKAI
jgi:phosphatidylglycerophosphate synthase